MIPLRVEKLLLPFSSSNIKSMLYIYMRLMKESQTIAHCWALKINNGMEAIWTLRAGMIDKQQLATWRTTYMWTLPHIQIVFIHIYTQYTNCTFIALYLQSFQLSAQQVHILCWSFAWFSSNGWNEVKAQSVLRDQTLSHGSAIKTKQQQTRPSCGMPAVKRSPHLAQKCLPMTWSS